VLTAGPKEITAKVIEWATWAGYPGLPAYIAAQITKPYLLIGAVVVAFLYALAVWIWPWWRARHPRLVPFQEAALIGFEEAERLGLEDVISSVDQSASDKLEWFRYAFLVDERVMLYGKKAPSRKLKIIPATALSSLRPHTARNELVSEFAGTSLVYTDVAVTRTSLRRYKRMLRRLARAKL
jgi:hypothetical protein